MHKEDRSTQWHAPCAVDISPSQNMAVMKSLQQTTVLDSQRSVEEKFNIGLTVTVAQHDLDHQWSDRWVDQRTSDPCFACSFSEEDDDNGIKSLESSSADLPSTFILEEPDVCAHSVSDHYDHRTDKDCYVRSEVTMVKLVESTAVDKISKDSMAPKARPVSTREVLSSTGDRLAGWIKVIKKELDTFGAEEAMKTLTEQQRLDHKQQGVEQLPCQMVFVEKPITELQRTELRLKENY
eukprot:2204119-Amphidinium_carterae.1